MNIRAQILAEILTPKQILELERKLKDFTDIDLGTFLSEYQSKKTNLVKSSYIKRSINPTIKKLLDTFGYEKPISSITINDAETFIIRIFDKSPHSARLIHRVCRAIWNWGIRREHFSKNVFTNVKLPKHQKGETITIPDDHFWLIIENVPKKLRDIYIVLRFTGMRVSELLSITWNEVQMRNKIIVVGSKSYITKSRKLRYIPMNKNVEKIFTEHHKKYYQTGRLVFCKTNGFPYQVDYISKKFKNACRRLNLPSSYHLHCLRSTLGSEMISKGVPIYTISQLLGHSSIKVTEQHYLKLETDSMRKAIELLDSIDKSEFVNYEPEFG